VAVNKIYEYVRKTRDDYRSQSITITEGYDHSQHETPRAVELYDNDRFLSGNLDELGREKPSHNIASFRKNVATRPTNLDTKDVGKHGEMALISRYCARTIRPEVQVMPGSIPVGAIVESGMA